jgi:hypothetical protein
MTERTLDTLTQRLDRPERQTEVGSVAYWKSWPKWRSWPRCKTCGKPFKPKTRNQRYCSPAHRKLRGKTDTHLRSG